MCRNFVFILHGANRLEVKKREEDNMVNFSKNKNKEREEKDPLFLGFDFELVIS